MMKLKELILDLLYPPRCTFCHRLVPHMGVCPECIKALPYMKGAELGFKIPHIAKCFSALRYEADVRQSLLRYKFHGMKGYSADYAEFMSKTIDEKEISCDIITWVPLSRKRLRRRGYDQAQLLCERIGEKQNMCCMRLLKKVRNNPPQSGTGRAEKRRANVKNVYEAVNSEYIKDRRVLLIDDIVTTGATLSECARVLRLSGAAEVTALTLACAGN